MFTVDMNVHEQIRNMYLSILGTGGLVRRSVCSLFNIIPKFDTILCSICGQMGVGKNSM